MTASPAIAPTIREAGTAFAAVLADLHHAAFADDGGESWDAAAFTTLLELPGTQAWIAAATDDTPQGFILIRCAADEAEIITIGVVPAARRGGVARALLAEGLAHAESLGAATLFLEVAEDNQAARRFYEAQGFSETGRRPRYYKRADGRIDAVLMARPI